MKEASEIAIRLGVKGADAIFISLAQEPNAELVTFDNEIKKKNKKLKGFFVFYFAQK
jgi:predicted nucleic acid-binding protein